MFKVVNICQTDHIGKSYLAKLMYEFLNNFTLKYNHIIKVYFHAEF